MEFIPSNGYKVHVFELTFNSRWGPKQIWSLHPQENDRDYFDMVWKPEPMTTSEGLFGRTPNWHLLQLEAGGELTNKEVAPFLG